MKNKMLTNLVKKLAITCCDSLTGGLFAAEIVKISGASNTFRGGYVTYQDIAKEILLPNAKEVLEEVGAISEKMAILMAETVKNQLKTNIAVSFTGNAGPISSENKEVGLVYIGIIFNDNKEVYELHLKGNRQEIRHNCISFVNDKLLSMIEK